MLARLGIRTEDRRDVGVGFTVLLLVMAGHAILETARDALFLATLPATMLPWAYLAMAGLTVLAATLNRRAVERFSRQGLLSISLLVGAGVTAAFWTLSSMAGSTFTLVAFYVWTGLLATVVVVQFWLQLADVFDVSRAKRVFAFVGAGGLLGATLGSALARGVLVFTEAQALLAVSSMIFVIAAALPGLFTKNHGGQGRRSSRPSRTRRESNVELTRLASDRYLQHLLAVVLLTTVVVTGVDFVFKSAVARRFAPGELGDFFSGYYAVLNGLGLVIQLVLAPRLLRLAGVTRTLLILPALIFALSLSFGLSGTLAAVLLLKGTDGSLRHSVNRVGTEILYLPLSRAVRDRFKALIEAVGQRGGQALASLLILAALAAEVTAAQMAWAIAILAFGWILTVFLLQPHYLELFREHLRKGTLETRVEVADLDLQTLEALVAALSSDEDAEVIAALDMFDAYGRRNLIPALILFHPSPKVVLRAYELLSESDRGDVRRLSARLLRHGDHEVRAAALRYLSQRGPGKRALRRHLDDDSAAVRATATVGLIACDYMDQQEGERRLRDVLEGPSDEARQALALSLKLLPPKPYAWVARALCQRGEPGLAGYVAQSLAAAPGEAHIPALIDLLAERDARGQAREALVKLGGLALDRLERAMSDTELPRNVRRHLPRTISQFPGQRPVRILLSFLPVERDDAVSFKILRGLGRMRAADPELELDTAVVLEQTRLYLRRAVTALSWRMAVDAMCNHDPRANTPTGELLSTALSDHEKNAMERVFRLLHILDPSEDFHMIYDGLRSTRAEMRAGGRELLEHLVPQEVRDGIVAMVDDAPDPERLTNAAAFHEPPVYQELLRLVGQLGAERSEDGDTLRELRALYAKALGAMLNDPSEVLRSVAGYHVAELGMDQLREDVERASRSGITTLAEITERALGLLGRREASSAT